MPQEVEFTGTLHCRDCGKTGEYKTQGGRVTVIEDVDSWMLYLGRYSTVEVVAAEDATGRQLMGNCRASCGDCDPMDFTRQCPWCDGLIDEDFEPGIYMDGSDELVCYSCFEDNGFRCEDCSGTYHYNDCNIIDEDRSVCPGCIENYVYCDNCDNYTAHGNMRYADDIIDMLDPYIRQLEIEIQRGGTRSLMTLILTLSRCVATVLMTMTGRVLTSHMSVVAHSTPRTHHQFGLVS